MCAYSVFNTFPVYPLSAKPLILLAFCRYRYHTSLFDRPEVQRLLDDAKTGVINTIIVKDLSRFGRNYIEVGQYVDYVFPAFGIRFIAIQDNVDTENRDSGAMEMMPIMNVFNEWHAANTSKKIRTVLKANAREGKYHARKAPYGYVKSDTEKKTPIIDEEAAAVVKRIFEMRASGLGLHKIADILNAEGTQPLLHGEVRNRRSQRKHGLMVFLCGEQHLKQSHLFRAYGAAALEFDFV